MSVKENIEFVKNEIDSEEKMLEGIIRFEVFLKKYKKPLLVLLGVILLGIALSAAIRKIEENRVLSANTVYSKLTKEPGNITLQKELEEKDDKLYALFRFTQAIEQNSTTELKAIASKLPSQLAMLSEYQAAMLSADGAALSSYLAKGDVPLKELAMLTEGFMLIQSQKISDAKSVLSGIPLNSPIKSIANALMHYTITKEDGK